MAFSSGQKKRSHLEGIWWWKIVWLFEKQLDTLWNYDDRKDTELFFFFIVIAIIIPVSKKKNKTEKSRTCLF